MASTAGRPTAGPDDDIASRRFDGLSIRDKRGRDTATVRVDVTRKGVKLEGADGVLGNFPFHSIGSWARASDDALSLVVTANGDQREVILAGPPVVVDGVLAAVSETVNALVKRMAAPAGGAETRAARDSPSEATRAPPSEAERVDPPSPPPEDPDPPSNAAKKTPSSASSDPETRDPAPAEDSDGLAAAAEWKARAERLADELATARAEARAAASVADALAAKAAEAAETPAKPRSARERALASAPPPPRSHPSGASEATLRAELDASERVAAKLRAELASARSELDAARATAAQLASSAATNAAAAAAYYQARAASADPDGENPDRSDPSASSASDAATAAATAIAMRSHAEAEGLRVALDRARAEAKAQSARADAAEAEAEKKAAALESKGPVAAAASSLAASSLSFSASSDALRRNALLERQLESATADISRLRAELDAASRRASSAAASEASEASRRRDAEAALARLRVGAEEVGSRLEAHARGEADSDARLTRERVRHAEAVARAVADRDESRRSLDAAEARLVALSDANATLETKVKTLEADVDALLDASARDRDAAERRVALAVAESESQRAELAGVRTELDAARDAREVLERELRDANAALLAADANRASAATERRRAEALTREAEAALARAADAERDAAREVVALRAEAERLSVSAEARRRERRLDDVVAELEAGDREVRELSHRSVATMEGLVSSVAALEEGVRRAGAEEHRMVSFRAPLPERAADENEGGPGALPERAADENEGRPVAKGPNEGGLVAKGPPSPEEDEDASPPPPASAEASAILSRDPRPRSAFPSGRVFAANMRRAGVDASRFAGPFEPFRPLALNAAEANRRAPWFPEPNALATTLDDPSRTFPREHPSRTPPETEPTRTGGTRGGLGFGRSSLVAEAAREAREAADRAREKRERFFRREGFSGGRVGADEDADADGASSRGFPADEFGRDRHGGWSDADAREARARRARAEAEDARAAEANAARRRSGAAATIDALDAMRAKEAAREGDWQVRLRRMEESNAETRRRIDEARARTRSVDAAAKEDADERRGPRPRNDSPPKPWR